MKIMKMHYLKIKSMKTIEINNKHYIDAKVVMLATDNKINALKGYSDKSILFNYKEEYKTLQAEGEYTSYFHLYFTSNEEIKEGDWYIWLDNNQICQGEEHIDIVNKHINNGDCRKIIATTDSSLKLECRGCRFNKNSPGIIYTCSCQTLPQPSKEFIQLFIESYNKGEVITDVLVEVETEYIKSKFTDWTKEGEVSYKNVLHPTDKLKLQDNTIIIKEKEESWDDIKDLFYVLHDDKIKEWSNNKQLLLEYHKWLKENYHPPIKK